MSGGPGIEFGTRAAIVALLKVPVELAWAEARATDLCMRRTGFRYPVYEAFRPAVVSPPRLGGLGRPIDVVEAERVGYGSLIRPLPGTDPLERAEADFLASLTPAERRAYHKSLVPSSSSSVQVQLSNGVTVGASDRGCLAKAREAVYGSVETFLRLTSVVNEVPAVGDAVMRDHRVRTALKVYADGMAAQSIPVKTPLLAVRLAEQRFGGTRPATGPVSDDERAMAVADATCQGNSHINRAIDDAVLDALAGWIDEHEPRILALAGLQRAALDNAKSILDVDVVTPRTPRRPR